MASQPIVQTVPYEQGSTPGDMEFVIVVSNGTPGAIVSFSAADPNPGGKPIALPPTKVTQASFIAGIQTTVNAGYSTTITYTYDPNGTAVSPGLSVTMAAFFSVSAASERVTSHVVKPGEPKTAEDELPLNITIANPMIVNLAQVVASVDETSAVLNTLDFIIQNPKNRPVVEIENQAGLTPATARISRRGRAPLHRLAAPASTAG